MYVLLAGGLDKPISGMTTMEIDWVRVYQFNENQEYNINPSCPAGTGHPSHWEGNSY